MIILQPFLHHVDNLRTTTFSFSYACKSYKRVGLTSKIISLPMHCLAKSCTSFVSVETCCGESMTGSKMDRIGG